jgi:hypothetical protein
MHRRIENHFRENYFTFYARYLKDPKIVGEDEYSALCPFHDDSNPSFNFNNKTGRYYCHGCGNKGHLVHFYAKLHGLDTRRDFREILKRIASDFNIALDDVKPRKGSAPPPWKRSVAAIFDYENQDGKVIAHTVKYSDGLSPRFMQFRPREAGGVKREKDLTWNGRTYLVEWGLARLEMPLYRLPEVVKASEVIVTEGEKDADNVRALGFTATTNPMGAGKWKPHHSEALRGKHVILCGDNDEPGREHVHKVGQALQRIAASVKVIQLPDLPPKGDVSDLLATYSDREEAAERLAILIENAPPFEPTPRAESKGTSPVDMFRALTPTDTSVSRFLDAEPPAREFILIDLLLKGIVGAIVGAGGVSKGFLLSILAVGISAGITVLRHFVPARSRKVLYISAEDPEDELHRRVHAIAQQVLSDQSQDIWKLLRENFYVKSIAGMHRPLMQLKDGIPVTTPHYDWLRKTVEAHAGLEILILDPKSRFQSLDENSADFATAFISYLEQLATDFGLTVLFSHHVTKASGGALTQTAARGSSGLVDACRWIANLRTLDDATARRYEIDEPMRFAEFAVTKSNYAPTLPRSVFFKRGASGVLIPVNLEFHRLQRMAESLSGLVAEAYRTNGETFTMRELRDQAHGKPIRDALRASFGRCSKSDMEEITNFALREQLASIKERHTGARPREVFWVAAMDSYDTTVIKT